MAKERKAHVVFYEPHSGSESATVNELNTLLNDGWLPIQTTGMGGASTGIDSDLAPATGYAALVILERQRDHAVSGFGG